MGAGEAWEPMTRGAEFLMCLERAMLSAYVDNELDGGRAQRMEAHLATCPACREQLRSYQTVSHALLESREPDVTAAGDRIWRRLETVRGALARRASFWTRGVRVPAPVAVAAMAGMTLLITTVAMWARVNDARVGPPPLTTLAPLGSSATSTVTESLAVSTREGLPWLEQGAIVIQLPEEPQFIQHGLPTILREAELPAVAAQADALR